jgi:AI-2 transport protein TqsA
MNQALQWSIVTMAAAAVTAGLFFFRDTLSIFALALILWLGIEGMARWLRAKLPVMPGWLALPIALVAILALFGLVGYGVAQNIGDIAGQTTRYKERIDQLTHDVYFFFQLPGPAPTISTIVQQSGGGRLIAQIGVGFQAIAANTVFILIYLGFLFPAAAQLTPKLDRIFLDQEGREHVGAILTAIRKSMQDYLWVQTVLSVVITVLTYITLLILGFPNALFWSFLIFFLNYIPTIGSLFAVLLPALAALLYGDFWYVAAIAGGVGFWQFVIGNLVQPRMMGESLNLSAIVVLLSLALWGSLWGIAGAFLAAPLTVMIMIILTQFPATRWLAILMSADGRPQRIRRGVTVVITEE